MHVFLNNFPRLRLLFRTEEIFKIKDCQIKVDQGKYKTLAFIIKRHYILFAVLSCDFWDNYFLIIKLL